MTIKPIWIAVALIVLGALWYLLPDVQIGPSAPTATTTTTTTSAPKQTTPAPKPAAQTPAKTAPKMAGIGTLTSLLVLKQPLVCDIKTTTGIVRTGTLYTANGMARLNFTATSMIDDGTNIYVWTKGATSGVKVAATVSSSGSVAASNGGVDPGTNLSYACNTWTVDASVFTPPSGVTF